MEVGDIITFRPIGMPPGRKAGVVLDINRVSENGEDSDWDVIRVLLCGTGEVRDILGSQLKDNNNSNDIW
jgi:predicted SnoaL-like aldol condensation-catalyzing enzyme